MRKRFVKFGVIAALFALLAGLLSIGSTGQATAEKWPVPAPVQPVAYTEVIVPLNATNGSHYQAFYSDTVDGRRGRLKIWYTVSLNSNCFHLDQALWETDWNAHPAFLANAVRLDAELDAYTAPGYYSEMSPAWGGSSVTLDDMPSYYGQYYLDSNCTLFDNRSDPKLRSRMYGVGQGAIENRFDDVAAME